MSWAGVQRNRFQLSMRPRPAARTLSLEPGKKAAARKVKKDAKTGKNQDVSFTIASGSSSQPILEAPKETPPKITTPFDRDAWNVVEERKGASASDLRDAVEEASTQVAGVTRVSLDED